MLSKTAKPWRSDTELIEQFIAGNSISFTELFDRYLPLVRKTGRNYYFRTLEKDDWEQEARIVMLKVIRKYDVNNGASFGTFFKFSLRNRALDILRRENLSRDIDLQVSPKQVILHQAIIDDGEFNPDQWIMRDEQMDMLTHQCSEYEFKIFSLTQLGKTKADIRQLMCCDDRSIDSALNRCRAKLRAIIRQANLTDY